MRNILHIDLDAFFCAVEELREPNLKGKPFAVGGRPESRGVVASCSYPARVFGVRSAMPMGRALRLCPHLIVVSSRHNLYSEYSQLMLNILNEFSSLVEQISIDEAFLDISEVHDHPESIAKALQKRINQEVKLPCSLGAASNKLVAKIANDFGKSSAPDKNRPPNAITVVEPGKEAEFLAPLSVERLWGVGPRTAERLHQLGIQTIGELASISEIELVREYGKIGRDLSLHARGIDDSPVVTWHEPKSISTETTFARDERDPQALIRVLREQTAEVGKRLREQGYAAATVKIKLRWPDFTTLTRQVTLTVPIRSDDEIFSAAQSLFFKNWSEGKAVRLIGVGVSGLDTVHRQLQLWEITGSPRKPDNPKLQDALDQLKERFGPGVIHRGADSPKK
jgi:DNA polymerase-4